MPLGPVLIQVCNMTPPLMNGIPAHKVDGLTPLIRVLNICSLMIRLVILASLNLMQFRHADKSFDITAYEYAVQLWTITLEISVLMAQFPSKEIAQLSYEYRTLGLGYANIGGLLMASGYSYDSDEARAICAALKCNYDWCFLRNLSTHGQRAWGIPTL